MKILLLTHAFNGLAQRLFVELRARGHTLSVEFDISDAVTEEALVLFRPDLVLAPFLKRRIPESVWSRVPCLVVHPGPPGDRGPSALDWSVLKGEALWGVTVLQASAEFDAGTVWAWRRFSARADASKASLYRREVTNAALEAVLEALGRFVPGSLAPGSLPEPPPQWGTWQPLVTQAQRAIDWQMHSSAEVLRRIRSADGFPGVVAPLFGQACRVFDAHAATPQTLARAPAGAPGDVVAQRGPALLVRTVDGGIWIGHVRRPPEAEGRPTLKLAATRAFEGFVAGLPELGVPLQREADEWDELRYREAGPPGAQVGWLDFDFHNGALSERQARRLIEALQFARSRPTQVLVLAGGADFFSNGIHLHEIEASSESAVEASWRAIHAIDDVCLAILQLSDRLCIAALRGNAGAGGCFLALAADRVWAHEAVLFNPHYKNMGNLYGSEYWTYLLPRRVGDAAASRVMRQRLPQAAREAAECGLIDEVFAAGAVAFEAQAWPRALALAADPQHARWVAEKAARRAADEAIKPLAAYRTEELARMRRNFEGFDPSYHVARHHFVHRKPHAWTPRHLATHR